MGISITAAGLPALSTCSTSACAPLLRPMAASNMTCSSCTATCGCRSSICHFDPTQSCCLLHSLGPLGLRAGSLQHSIIHRAARSRPPRAGIGRTSAPRPRFRVGACRSTRWRMSVRGIGCGARAQSARPQRLPPMPPPAALAGQISSLSHAASYPSSARSPPGRTRAWFTRWLCRRSRASLARRRPRSSACRAPARAAPMCRGAWRCVTVVPIGSIWPCHSRPHSIPQQLRSSAGLTKGRAPDMPMAALSRRAALVRTTHAPTCLSGLEGASHHLQSRPLPSRRRRRRWHWPCEPPPPPAPPLATSLASSCTRRSP